MNPEQFRTIDDLLQAALSRPAAERNPFLEQACADDELRREVSALLDTHEHEGVLDVGVAPLVAEITSPVGLRLIEGERLGPYEVLGALGAGSMGDVYLANDVRLGRRVALKLLPHEWTDDPRQTSRFEKEARAASALNHPNIITVYDVGVVDGHRFMAAEYVDGETLRARLSLITFREALDITTQIARGLAAAHAAGIVHRDVKPENVMVRRDGLVKIVDFGLAKLVASGPLCAPPSESIPGMVLGTAAYMSAEQAQGIEVDARSDIFSVGVVLFEMLVGHAPFAGTSSSEVIASILRDNPPAISQLRHDLPRALDRIVSRALEKDPERRYQRIEDLRTDLERVAADLQDLPTATRVTPPWNWRRASRALDGAVLAARRRPRVVLGLAVVVAASVITFGSLSRPPTVHSIVVLPFAAERGDQDADIVAAAITEGLKGRLAQIPELRMIAVDVAPGSMEPAAAAADTREKLGVETALTGRVSRQGNHVSVTVSLVGGGTGRRSWAATYEGSTDELPVLQDVVFSAAVEQLGLVVPEGDRQRSASPGAVSAEAYQLYIKGRYFWNRRTIGDLETSVRYFDNAAKLDPTYALAYAGLADAFLSLGSNPAYSGLRRDRLTDAKNAALKALALDETLVEARVSLGAAIHWRDWDWAGAESEFKRALLLNPLYAPGHHRYGLLLAFTRRFDEAIAELQRAEKLDPVSAGISADTGLVYYFAKRSDEAIAQLGKAIELAPDYGRARVDLINAYLQKGMRSQAAAELDSFLNIATSNVESRGSIDRINERLGRPHDPRKVLRELRARRERGDPAAGPMAIAELHARLGEDDEAFRWLNIAYEERLPFLFRIYVDPRWEDYRIYTDPRWTDLLQRMNLRVTR